MIADDNNGLNIINITNPRIPELLRSIDTDGNTFRVCSFENEGNQYALIANSDKKGLKVIEIKISNLYSNYIYPMPLGNIAIGVIREISTLENGSNIYALIANNDKGLKIIDITDPR